MYLYQPQSSELCVCGGGGGGKGEGEERGEGRGRGVPLLLPFPSCVSLSLLLGPSTASSASRGDCQDQQEGPDLRGSDLQQSVLLHTLPLSAQQQEGLLVIIYMYIYMYM